MNRRNIVVCVSLLILAQGINAGPRRPASAIGAQQIHERPDSAPDLDILHYELDLTIYPDVRTLDGTVELVMKTSADSLGEIVLDLVQLQVEAVLEGTDSVNFSRMEDRLILFPDPPLQLDEVRAFTAVYHGSPSNEGSGGFGGFFFSGGVAFSMGVGLYSDPPSMGRYWFPSHDHPSDKATAEITVRVPDAWIGVSNGALISDSHEDSTHVTVWRTDYPIATYLMMVAAGPYVEIRDDTGPVPIRHYVRPQEESRARDSFARVPQMINLLTRLFGSYPFERFGYASAPIGAMEHQTCVTYPWSSIDGTFEDEWLAVHELGHMWWGDCVTYADWSQVWVSEGFATYCQALWEEEINGPAGYRAEMYRQMVEYLGGVAAEGYFPLDDPVELWGVCAYEKGSCILHMLRQEIGDSLFFDGLAEYRERHEYGNATTDSVEAAFEAVAGTDLTWFFDQWLRSPGHPRLSFRYATYPFGNGDVGLDIEVTQEQTIGPIFRFTMDAVCDVGDSTYFFPFVDSTAVHINTFRIPGIPHQIRFDPHHDVLFDNRGTEQMDRLYLRSIDIADTGDEDGGMDPDEEADIVVGLYNPLSDLNDLTLTLYSMDPELEILDGSSTIQNLPSGEVVSNQRNPFRIRTTAAPPHAADLEVVVETATGGQIHLPMHLQIGPARRLLVDDDLPLNSHEQYYLSALDTLPEGNSRELWSTGLLGPISSVRLAKYADSGMVTWYTGDIDSMALDASECQIIMNFLDEGGSLFLTGQNALDELTTFAEGQSLLSDYFHLQVIDPDYPGNRTVAGEDGDVIGNGLRGLLQGDGGADNQNGLSEIRPQQDAAPIMRYFGTDPPIYCGARVAHRGRVVVLSFGFEAINQTQPHFLSREQLIRRVADWLEGPGTDVPERPSKPILTVSAPEPFRTNSALRLTADRTLPVTVSLYDLTGRILAPRDELLLRAGDTLLNLPVHLAPGTIVVTIRSVDQIHRYPLIYLP